MRRRMIDPCIWTDGDFQRLPVEAQLLFLAHISAADDEGRGALDAADFKALAFAQKPEVDEARVEELMALLSTSKKKPKLPFVVYYTDRRGGRVWALPNWHLYQTIDRPRPSKIPPPASSVEHKLTGAKVRPAQAELLRVMTAERGIDLEAFLQQQGLAIETLLARQVTGLKQLLQAIPIPDGKSAIAALVRRHSNVIKLAAQRGDWELIDNELEQISLELWPKVRAEVRAMNSELTGSSMADVRASLVAIYGNR